MECCFDFEIDGVRGKLDRFGYYRCEIDNTVIVNLHDRYYYIPSSIFIRLESVNDFRLFDRYTNCIYGYLVSNESIQQIPIRDYIANGVKMPARVKDNYLVQYFDCNIDDKKIVCGILIEEDENELVEIKGAKVRKLVQKNKIYRKLRAYNFNKMRGDNYGN